MKKFLKTTAYIMCVLCCCLSLFGCNAQESKPQDDDKTYHIIIDKTKTTDEDNNITEYTPYQLYNIALRNTFDKKNIKLEEYFVNETVGTPFIHKYNYLFNTNDVNNVEVEKHRDKIISTSNYEGNIETSLLYYSKIHNSNNLLYIIEYDTQTSNQTIKLAHKDRIDPLNFNSFEDNYNALLLRKDDATTQHKTSSIIEIKLDNTTILSYTYEQYIDEELVISEEYSIEITDMCFKSFKLSGKDYRNEKVLNYNTIFNYTYSDTNLITFNVNA